MAARALVLRALVLAALALLLLPARAGALPASERQALDRLCRTTAAEAPSAAALAVAATAVQEHEAFGGHVIGAGGRMTRFGAVESDALRGDAAGGAPWRQVMRYWETLGALDEGPLQVRRVPRLAGDAGSPDTGDLAPLAGLLSRLNGGNLTEAEREALVQSAMRAAASDIPWSAAFVSHVVLTAGVPRTRFSAAMAHLDYVAEAARRSRDEARGLAGNAFYRACDPHRTAARPGDLLCLHRHAAAGQPAGAEAFATLVPALAEGERPVWNLHCDVVVGREAGLRTLTLIGGNVLQSVARRTLATDRRGVLRMPRRPAPCPGEGRVGPLCQPEAAPWFVLLQAAGDAPP